MDRKKDEVSVEEKPGLDMAITGANGAVGTDLVRLLSQGAPWGTTRVRVLVRHPAAAQSLHSLGAEVYGVQYRRPDTIQQAIAGVQVLVHLAGALIPRRGETLQQANVVTTSALVDAAAQAGVQTFVYLSYPGADTASPNHYLRAKGLAELRIQQAGFAGSIFRVPLILGPGSPSLVQLCRMARRPILPLVSGGTVRVQPIAQADVLRAIVWAITAAPKPLRVFTLVGPETLTYVALLRLVCARLGTHPRVVSLPRLVVWLSAYLAGALLPSLGWNRSVFDILFREHLADSAEACACLALQLTPLQDTLEQALSAQV